MSAELTRIVRTHEKKIKTILASGNSIIEVAVSLRMFARAMASEYYDLMHYTNIAEFYKDYADGTCPISKLEGEGIIIDDVLFLKKCPMATLLDNFKVNGAFPDNWKRIPQEYMDTMKNEAILHPLCIVHQSFRDELSKKIPKGTSFVHSIAVACRSGSNGKVVFNDFGLQMSDMSREKVAQGINGMACAFYVR